MEAREYIPGKVYVDIRFLKFIDLGMLIAHPDMNNETYIAIRDIVVSDDFVNRQTNDVKYIFRNIPDIEKFDITCVDCEKALIMAPEFDGAIDTISEYIATFKSKAEVFPDIGSLSLTIDISYICDHSNDHAIDPKLMQRVAQEYANLFKMDVTVVSDGLVNHKNDFNAYFVDNVSYFNDIFIDDLNAGKLHDNRLYCYKGLPLASLPDIQPDQIPMMINSIELIMDTAIDFSFLNMPKCAT